MKYYNFCLILRCFFIVILFVPTLNCAEASATPSKEKLAKTAKTVLKLIKSGDFKGLSEHVHEKRGVEFSASDHAYSPGPWTTKFSKQSLSEFMKSNIVFFWGEYDGRDSDDNDIKLTPKEYYKQIIYDVDYEKIADSVIIGNSVTKMPKNFDINFPFIFQTYPNAAIVHYYYKGSRKNHFMDYKKLTLIFESIGKKWFLIAIWNGRKGI